ncbi:EthD domain-containing protein [Novosphingobium sp. ERN07]|uniref:EthD domain-containing protein n=1 Tax=Novosphingobium sp. ERN07 TaxID=2726187 RepID=UPI00145763B4|nr:EthD domain-containing protein [Novosphingobium sp. ERN07]NLR70642.1 EthD domain-containing protein [Novosphingobium sp. ERN07]
MEKVIAALWAPDGQDHAEYGAHLLKSLPAALAAAGAHNIRLNVRDAAVAAGDGLVQRWQAPQQAAIAQFWMPSANARFRGEVDAALAAHSASFAAWLVCESTIIANTAHSCSRNVSPGKRAAGEFSEAKHFDIPERTWGWSQASFISFRADMTRAEAIAHWHSHHTRVAIETQANFEYVQNLIVRPLTENAPAYDAFVEECFPLEALTQPEVFFDAVGQPDKFAANTAAMMESCNGFIDFTRIDIIPTSQFDCG